VSSFRNGEQAVEDLAYEIDVAGQGVDLWRALQGWSHHRVHHAFEYDGSITLTIGPEFPELKALDIKASYGRELNVNPGQVFLAATRATDCVAELAVRCESWAKDGYIPADGHPDSFGQDAS